MAMPFSCVNNIVAGVGGAGGAGYPSSTGGNGNAGAAYITYTPSTDTVTYRIPPGGGVVIPLEQLAPVMVAAEPVAPEYPPKRQLDLD